MKIDEWLTQGAKELKTAGVASSRLDCLLLLENELGEPREWILSHDETELTETQLKSLNKNLARRIKHEPIAYIIGSKEFYGRTFLVAPDVLIPRPESESLIEILTRSTPCAKDGPLRIVDIGTGSGCLAITAKLELPNTEVIAIDISNAALAIAKQNADTLMADVQFLKSDLLSSVSDLQSSVFLANLPYVPDDLITSEEITKEPALALFSGSDGLDHYKRFWQQVTSLAPGHKPRYIITECLEDQHQQMKTLALRANYKLDRTKDLAQLFSLSEPRPA